MSVAFSATQVYEYLFSKEPDAPDTHELSYDAVNQFCHVLEREIVVHSMEDSRYQYVFFDLGTEAMRDFFISSRGRFLDFGNRVVFTGECSEETGRQIEKHYGDSPVITNALRLARRTARTQSSALSS